MISNDYPGVLKYNLLITAALYSNALLRDTVIRLLLGDLSKCYSNGEWWLGRKDKLYEISLRNY